jgi:MFS family permease
VPFLRDRFTVLWDVFGNPRLRRLELGYGGFYAADWAHFVAISVYAYEHGGATSVGVFGLVRMSASAVAAPFGGALADRRPRQQVLLAIHAGRAVALGAAAAALASGGPRALVFALAGLASLCGGPFRPAHLALLPTLAATPQQLVGANVASSAFEGGAVLAGPAVAGGLLAVSTPAAAVAVSAAIAAWAALLAFRLGRERDWTRPRAIETPLRETLSGLRTLRDEPRPRLVILLFASQSFVRGLMNVLLVTTALEFLHAGNSGVGFLNSALGVGGLAGGLATVRLAGRRRLAAPFTVALALWGAPLAAVAAWRSLWFAFACILVIGAANAVLDVTGYTLVQRTVDDAVLGRVFGVFEILVSGAAGVGSIMAPLLLHELDVRGALLVSGVLLPALALLSRRRLHAFDDSTVVPQHEVDLLRSIPVFRPLSVTALERLAGHLVAVHAEAGEAIVEQGDTGDRFYVIGDGRVDVVCDGERVATLGPGDYFGEIALLRDVPRVATCRASTAVELLALRRDVFVPAVTGNLRSEREVEDVAAERLAELEVRARGLEPPRASRPSGT